MLPIMNIILKKRKINKHIEYMIGRKRKFREEKIAKNLKFQGMEFKICFLILTKLRGKDKNCIFILNFYRKYRDLPFILKYALQFHIG